MLNKKGFTLIELLGVIAILGILITIATIGVLRYINVAHKQKAEENIKALKEAAINYALSTDIYLNPCHNPNSPESCDHEIKPVSFLKENNYFKDINNACDLNGNVLIYADLKYNFQVKLIPADLCAE